MYRVLYRYGNVLKKLSWEIKWGLLIIFYEINHANDDANEPPKKQKLILVFDQPKPWPNCGHTFLNFTKKVILAFDILKEILLPLQQRFYFFVSAYSNCFIFKLFSHFCCNCLSKRYFRKVHSEYLSFKIDLYGASFLSEKLKCIVVNMIIVTHLIGHLFLH